MRLAALQQLIDARREALKCVAHDPLQSTGAASDVDDGGMSPMMSTPQHTAAHAIVDLLPIDPSRLPPAPEEPPNPVLLKNVEKFHNLRKSKGVTVNGDLYDKKEFHNPGILELLMTTYKIKEVMLLPPSPSLSLPPSPSLTPSLSSPRPPSHSTLPPIPALNQVSPNLQPPTPTCRWGATIPRSFSTPKATHTNSTTTL